MSHFSAHALRKSLNNHSLIIDPIWGPKLMVGADIVNYFLWKTASCQIMTLYTVSGSSHVYSTLVELE